MINQRADNDAAIAIIGIAGRFPDAQNVSQFWANLCNGVNSVRPIPEADLELSDEDAKIAQNNPNYVKMAAPLQDADKFDAAFFGVFPQKAVTMDPHQRLFLESCWHALEDGGYTPSTYSGSIGVFAGCYMNTYLLASLRTNPDFIHDLADVFHGGTFQNEIGFEKDYLATQVSYLLNLRGPSLTIQTACSTSLVAIATACRSLAARDCDMALAGAATLRFPQNRGYLYADGGMLSPDGSCKTFDERANGTIFGNGVASILLKRLDDAVSDGDDIYAVIRGWGMNNDGNRKGSYAAPSVEGQVDAIAKAHEMAAVGGESITYIEAHGTGTSLGDPIEIDALSQVFRRTSDEKQYCAIGSVKTNVGHLDCTAGIAGLIKTALSLKYQLIPPTLNFKKANPLIDFPNSPFFVNTELKEWPQTDEPRRAGVSSFGVGGTNVHVVLEEAPPESLRHSLANDDAQSSGQLSRPYPLITLSARSENALAQAAADLATHLKSNPELELADVAFTLNSGREEFAYTYATVATDRINMIEQLEPSSSTATVQPIVKRQSGLKTSFMFPGQGSQYANMGRALYETEPVYRAAFDACSEILKPHLGFELTSHLFIDGEPTPIQNQRITETAFAQPAIYAMEYSMAQLWISRNVQPDALIGHSVGEFSAATVAGIFTLEDAMTLVAMRGQMMQSLPAGLMVAVRLPEEEVIPYLRSDVTIGAVNSPQLCVLSGTIEAVQSVQAELEEAGVVCRPLHTSHAFHSMMMDPILAPFQEAVAKMTLRIPQIPVVSTVTGQWLTDEEAQSPVYWTENLRKTVRFTSALENLLGDAKNSLLEVGPGQVLTMLARQHPNRDKKQPIFASSPHPKQEISAAAFFSETTGQLWQAGVPVNRETLHAGESRKKVHLPGYPFERKRFWYDVKPNSPKTLATASVPNDTKEIGCASPGSSIAQPELTPVLGMPTPQLYPTDQKPEEMMHRLVEQQLGLINQQLRALQQR